jgi:histidinol-phosphate aminotransferase
MPVRRALALVEPYRPQPPMRQLQAQLGLDRIVKLASNEGPFGPLPAAVAAFEASTRELNRYPDAGGTRDRAFDLDALLAACAGAKLAYLANPNNPTGTLVARDDLRRFVDELPPGVLGVLDEAYGEYAEPEPEGVALVREGYERVCVLRTFSKVFGLAALRVGYAIASPQIADALNRVRPLFNVNQPAQEAAFASLHETDAVRRRIAHTRAARDELYETLRAAGLDPIRSHANFVYADVPGLDGDGLADRLLHAGFIVRALRGFGAPGAIRVTVGTDEEMRLFAAAIQDAEISRL